MFLGPFISCADLLTSGLKGIPNNLNQSFKLSSVQVKLLTALSLNYFHISRSIQGSTNGFLEKVVLVRYDPSRHELVKEDKLLLFHFIGLFARVYTTPVRERFRGPGNV